MHTRTDFDLLMTIARQGQINPVIAATYPLDETPDPGETPSSGPCWHDRPAPVIVDRVVP
ncbi:hypothetical protein [Rothia uropygialis]|uniref:hypothetical protein n=1 Tax=Kocuria sp. 36 TaxID=1415402 RepID=UPI00101C53F5|nr:hypothetical protein [Kocuria sp. 36]